MLLPLALSRLLRAVAQLTFIAFVAATVSSAAVVGREPPAVYATRLAPQLTAIESVLALEGTSAKPTDSGSILLNERLVFVDEQGRRTSVWHLAYKTLTDAGVRTNGEDVFSFRKHEQEAYLVLAETIQPDGTRQSVQPNAVLIQSPQRQAQYSLYDDLSELKIIFPNVKPGSVTHLIVVIEDLVSKIPGEFNHHFVWGGTWATERLRIYLDVPPEIGGRLKIETVGGGIPPLVTQRGDDGRIQHRWSLDGLLGERYELSLPPSNQVGPAIHLSSLQSWDVIGDWYRGLLEGRGDLQPELARQAETWTAEAASREEIIARLHAKVADEVRYVGLEFGAADYQPHPCNEVWANQYGDCKDKANLLVALLGHCGIEAYTALINTSHQGLIDRRTPDFRAFDHAIVAIPQDGGFLFCDPTIAYSTPGMLSPGSADRDALIISAQHAEWARTPSLEAGEMRYEFDLKLAENGDVAGWLTMHAKGYYGASERRRFTRLEPHQLRSEMSERIRGFYPAAEIIDAERVESARDQPLTIKVYFTVAGTEPADRKQSLAFPASSGLLVNVGHDAERQTPFFVYRDRIHVSATIALPEALTPEAAAPDFQLDSRVADFRAKWWVAPAQCRAELDLAMKASVVSRDEFPRLYQGIRSLQAWLSRPVLLAAAAATPSRAAPTHELDFPLMPTGDGQIDLVEKRYPENGNLELRRLALERTLQYFPADKNTVFRAGTRLALIDWNADRNEAAHERLAALLKSYAGQIAPETYAWAETIEGLALRDMKRDEEARIVLERVSRDRALSAARRGWAGVPAAEIMSRTSVPAALELLLEVAALPNGATDAVSAKIAHLYLREDRAAELKAYLLALVDSRPTTCEDEFAALLDLAQSWNAPADGARLRTLVDLVGGIRPKPGATLVTAIEGARNKASVRLVRERLREALAAPPFLAWQPTDEAPRTLAELNAAVEKAGDAGDAALGFRLCLQSIAQHGVDDGFTERVWRAASYADWTQRQGRVPIEDGICEFLLDSCESLPRDDDHYYEGRLIRATRTGRMVDRNAEIAALRAILATPEITEKYALHVSVRLARTLIEVNGDYPAALELYRSIEPLASSYRTGADAIYRATLIQLHLGNDREALRLIELLRAVPEDTMKTTATKAQIAELIALVDTGRAPEVWNANRTWWPRWKKFALPVLGAEDTSGEIVPVISDLGELGVSLGEAKRDNRPKDYFTHLGQLMSAARWLPSLGIEIASLYATTASVATERAMELRELVILVLEAPHPPEIANLPGRLLQLAVHYIDGGRPADTLKVAVDYARWFPDDDAMARAMRRLRGYAATATKRDHAGAAEALERDLAQPEFADSRAMAVGILADLYRQLDRVKDEERLLRRELANPVVAADTAGRKTLETRLSLLTAERDFGAELERWRLALPLPWYDYAAPTSLDDPRLRNLEQVLESAERHFAPAEQIKLYLLAAGDMRRTSTQRQQSFRSAIQRLLQIAPTYSFLQRIATTVADNDAFDDESRISTVWLTLIYLSGEGRKTEYAHWRQHALCDRFNATIMANLALLDRWVATDERSASSLLELAAQLSREEITLFGGFVLSDLFDRLITLGEFAAAEEFNRGIPAWRFAADVPDTLPTKQLDYARRLRQAKSFALVHQRLAALTVARYPKLADAMPKNYRDLRVRPELTALAPAETRDACLHWIKSRRISPVNFSFWGVLLRSIANEPGMESFVAEMFAAALAAAETDDQRAQLIQVFVVNTDSDNPQIRDALMATLQAEIDPARHPAAHLARRLYEFKVASRLGQEADVESAFAGLSDPAALYYGQLASLDVHTRDGNLAALRRTVDGMRTDLLLSPSLVIATMPALILLNRDEELEVARGVAKTELRKDVAQAWAAQDEDAAMRVVRLTYALKEPGLVPQAWVQEVGRDFGNPFVRGAVRATIAYVQSDWEQVARETAAILHHYPTHYHYYWLQGRAAYQLGDKATARTALTTYVRYAKDESDHPRALELLAELGGDRGDR